MKLAIIQARFSSTRLPGKVLKPILGVPMLLRHIERVSRAKQIDDLVVATSDDSSDDEIERICRTNRIECYRGSLDDVLDRFYKAAIKFRPDDVVRLTADCPLADPDVIDHVIEFYEMGNFDYASNTVEPTFPDGLDVEVFRAQCLYEAWKEAKLPSEREHVTPFIHRPPTRYDIGNYRNATDLSGLRWTVDEEVDFQLITGIYAGLYPKNQDFRMNDILAFLEEHSHLKTVNAQFHRNEVMEKSLKNDAVFLSRTHLD